MYYIFTCVGNGDGYLDIFKVNEYGNLLERIKCNHSLGIDCMQVLRTNVILTASNEDDSLKLVSLVFISNIAMQCHIQNF